jgi:SAM-dependent methyltransferase
LKTTEKRISWEASVEWLKTQPEHADLVRACFFDDPPCAAAERYFLSLEWQAVRALVGPVRGRALDLGSGRGISAYALARDGWDTTALEPDPSREVGAGAIRHLAAQTGVRVSVSESWGEELAFETGSFDLVYCRQVLHHARDLAALCREAARVLKPNGLFVATREHVLSRREDLDAFLAGHPLHHLYGGENAFLLEEYTSAITGAGLTLVKTLNPLESDINVFPSSLSELKTRIARKLWLPSAKLVPDWILTWRGRMMDNPGRMYSFFSRKIACG